MMIPAADRTIQMTTVVRAIWAVPVWIPAEIAAAVITVAAIVAALVTLIRTN